MRILSALLVLAANALTAQEGPPPPFDVVSVKHSGSIGNIVLQAGGSFTVPTRGFRYTGGKVTCNLPLSSIIQEAYGIKEWQLEGPAWMNVELYDFAAVMPDGTSKETARLMMRTALADRFGLQFHRQPKEFSVYGLVAIPGSSKLEEVSPAPQGYSSRNGRGTLEAEPGMPLRALEGPLTRAAGKPVIDQTGLNGWYKVKLHWEFDPAPGQNAGADSGILSAISQIGLKLTPQKKMLDSLIIDKVAKEPTEN